MEAINDMFSSIAIIIESEVLQKFYQKMLNNINCFVVTGLPYDAAHGSNFTYILK
jgi:hypothetical protein